MPATEVEINETLVRGLLTAQYPALADQPLVRLPDRGWDNTVYRLGREFSVRLPRRAQSSDLVQGETRWLPEISRKLPIPVPVPVHAGSPTDQYPWHWSINRWVAGEPVGVGELRNPLASATALAAFLNALHYPAPLAAPINKVRGVHLAARQKAMAATLQDLQRHGWDTREIAEKWRLLSRAPRYKGYRHWIHGDLHSANILAHDGYLSGVIDFGDLTRGDPAVDFAVAWMMFDAADREPLRIAAESRGRGTWQRAQAWALYLACAVLANSADNPLLAEIGSKTLQQAME